MQRSVRALVGVSLVLVLLGPLSSPADVPADRQPTVTDKLLDKRDGLQAEPAAPATPVEREVLVVVEVERGARLAARHPIEVERVYGREGARRLRGYVPLTEVRNLSADPHIEAIRIERYATGTGTTHAADGVGVIDAGALHAQGVTGENVTVGVIDAGFRVSDPEIASSVGAYRAFDAENSDWRHGTAVASVVADTAPGAELHLAAVGTTTSSAEYRRAVAWLQASGVDVIVDAGSYFGRPGEDAGRIAAIAADASEETLFVAAAGNYARRHWQGTHNATRGEWVAFANGSTVNPLAGGRPIAGRVRVSVDATPGDYDLYLFRRQAGRDPIVAASTGRNGTTERIATRVPRGQYYVAVKAHDATGTARVELFASHSLAHREPNGSITAPATAPGVLAVGAVHDGSVRPFSSRGGGDARLDLVAPDDVALPGVTVGEGTSYAAPYAAGTAALLLNRYPSFSPRKTARVLRVSATDVGPSGVDPATGHGRVDASSAAMLAAANSRYAPVNASST